MFLLNLWEEKKGKENTRVITCSLNNSLKIHNLFEDHMTKFQVDSSSLKTVIEAIFPPRNPVLEHQVSLMV